MRVYTDLVASETREDERDDVGNEGCGTSRLGGSRGEGEAVGSLIGELGLSSRSSSGKGNIAHESEQNRTRR